MQGRRTIHRAEWLWEQLILFLMGGTAYLGAELVWRDATHWTMFFAGGACFCGLVRLADCPGLPLPVGAAAAAMGITVMELVVGQTCLLVLRVRVWDYRPEWGNIAGFICPRYTVLWYFLCLWLLMLLRLVQKPRRFLPAPAAGL